MICELVLLSPEPDPDGKYRYGCAVCAGVTRNRSPTVFIKRPCGTLPVPGFGPGTELQSMLHDELGIVEDGCKLCKHIAKRMDFLGVEGVRQRRVEFAERLRKAAAKKGWATKLTAAAGSLKSGLALRLKPWDLYGSLVDEACRRAQSA
jgi:hypothetical protein